MGDDKMKHTKKWAKELSIELWTYIRDNSNIISSKYDIGRYNPILYIKIRPPLSIPVLFAFFFIITVMDQIVGNVLWVIVFQDRFIPSGLMPQVKLLEKIVQIKFYSK
jgi:hypothetical protein